MSDWFQWAIVAFILLSILWHVWKGGAANPEGTGSLGRKVNGLSVQVSVLSGRLGEVETEMKELKDDSVSTRDIVKLEQLFDERLRTVRAEMAAHQQLSKSTNRNVQRIYDLMLEKSLGK